MKKEARAALLIAKRIFAVVDQMLSPDMIKRLESNEQPLQEG